MFGRPTDDARHHITSPLSLPDDKSAAECQPPIQEIGVEANLAMMRMRRRRDEWMDPVDSGRRSFFSWDGSLSGREGANKVLCGKADISAAKVTSLSGDIFARVWFLSI